MAHELAFKKDGRAAMAFVGETPWHGLGQSVTKGASIGVWQREAGLDWHARSGDVISLGSPNPAEDLGAETIKFNDYQALFRSDTLAPLGIVSAKYKPVQPAAILEFFRDMIEQGGW